MNKHNILELANFIETAEYKFDMRESMAKPECGSAGCIGAHAAVLWPEVRSGHRPGEFTWSSAKLAEKLGLTPRQVQLLCFHPYDPDGFLIPYSEVTRKMAVKALRNLAKTGVVVFKTE